MNHCLKFDAINFTKGIIKGKFRICFGAGLEGKGMENFFLRAVGLGGLFPWVIWYWRIFVCIHFPAASSCQGGLGVWVLFVVVVSGGHVSVRGRCRGSGCLFCPVHFIGCFWLFVGARICINLLSATRSASHRYHV